MRKQARYVGAYNRAASKVIRDTLPDMINAEMFTAGELLAFTLHNRLSGPLLMLPSIASKWGREDGTLIVDYLTHRRVEQAKHIDSLVAECKAASDKARRRARGMP